MSNEMHQILTHIKATGHKFKLPELEDAGLVADTDPQKSLTLCPVCRSPFIKPTTLSCGYTLCLDCIPKSPNFQCPSFACLRMHSNISKTTVLVEEIQSSILVDKNIQSIKTLLDCPICITTLSDPTTTSCGHTFCKSCLNQTVNHFQCNKRCPICRSELNKVNGSTQLINRWVSLFSTSLSIPEKSLNECIPVVEVDNAVIFPLQSCLVHISKEHSLFAEMTETPPNRAHYAICLSKNKDNQYDCIGTMLQLSNIEYIRDLRKCIILAKGLYHIQLNNISMESDYLTGDIIPLDYEILDPFYVSLSKSKRWTLPISNNETGQQQQQQQQSSNDSIPRKRRRPCSMRSSLSSPNHSTTIYRQDNVMPGACTRPTWNDLMAKQLYGHSSTPLLPVVSTIAATKTINIDQ